MPRMLDATSTEWVTLEEVRAHLNVSVVTQDDEVVLVQQAAQAAVEGVIGPVLWRTVTRTATATGASLVLPVTPVVSVTSLTGAGSPVTYTLDATTGILSDVHYEQPLVVTYVAGRTVVGDDIRYATLLIAAHLWESQRAAAPSGLQEPDEDSATLGLGYAIPRRALDLLGPHQMLPGIA